MKGIVHFLTGVALATFFPDVVALAREGSLLPVLGGVGGLLPDLLDFRFVRYFERYHTEIDPGPVPEDASAQVAAGAVADALATTMRDAYASREPRRAIAHTVPLGRDLWRRYAIRFDPDRSTVSVRIGPLVSTGGAVMPGTTPPDTTWAERHLGIPLVDDYIREYDVDIFTGPSFTFTREGNALVVTFLDWHHRWTHSLPLAALVGICVGGLSGLVWGGTTGLWGGLLTWIGFTAHALEDQLGYMGCNLLWPFTRKRIQGLKLLHAGEPIPNFLVAWTSLALILLDLDRFGGPGVLPLAPYLVVAVGMPWLFLGGAHLLRRLRATARSSAQAVGDAERLAEIEDLGD